MSEMTTTDKKPVKEKELLVVNDEGLFEHPTGDTYDGFFEVKKKDKLIKMHGPGIYTTAEGDIYNGTWEADRPVDNITISYTDGSNYNGQLKDWTYYGYGKYTYPDGTALMNFFGDNCPQGELTLIDPNGQKWLGHAETGYGWLQPCNHFYQVVEKPGTAFNRSRKAKQSISGQGHGDI